MSITVCDINCECFRTIDAPHDFSTRIQDLPLNLGLPSDVFKVTDSPCKPYLCHFRNSDVITIPLLKIVKKFIKPGETIMESRSRHIYECQWCLTAGRSSDLKNHLALNELLKDGVNKVICEKCLKKFTNKTTSDLQAQMKSLVEIVNANGVGAQNIYGEFRKLHEEVNKQFAKFNEDKKLEESKQSKHLKNDDDLAKALVSIIWKARGMGNTDENLYDLSRLQFDVQVLINNLGYLHAE